MNDVEKDMNFLGKGSIVQLPQRFESVLVSFFLPPRYASPAGLSSLFDYFSANKIQKREGTSLLLSGSP
jgi:hypothetical protein